MALEPDPVAYEVTFRRTIAQFLGSTGAPGRDGASVTGPPGSNGADGASGFNGIDGASGIDGTAGQPGADGAPGLPGTNGVDGSPGIGVASIDCVQVDALTTAFRFTLTDSTTRDVPGSCTPPLIDPPETPEE